MLWEEAGAVGAAGAARCAVVNCSEEEGSGAPRCPASFPQGRSPLRLSAQGGVYRFLQKICGILIFIPSRTRKLNPNHCSKA